MAIDRDEMSAQRFVYLQQQDGRWMVQDHLQRKPASLGGQLLVDRPLSRARAACEILNRIYSAGLQSEHLDVLPDHLRAIEGKNGCHG